jgi:hypothetical protein
MSQKPDSVFTPMTPQEVNIERFCRAFAERYKVSWGELDNNGREAWRKQVGELLVYIDPTAFRSFLPPVGIPVEPTESGDNR